MTDIINAAANLFFGSTQAPPPNPMLSSPVNEAVIKLLLRGHSVSPSTIPGLWNVSGYPELTSGQLLDVAFNPSKTL